MEDSMQISQETRRLLAPLDVNDIHIRITIFESRIKRWKSKMVFSKCDDTIRFFSEKIEQAIEAIREHEIVIHERKNRIKKSS
tara:strand:+ start:524 stop:772 length:249 start_codon:yes stop_codon:yes gene_type:complete